MTAMTAMEKVQGQRTGNRGKREVRDWFGEGSVPIDNVSSAIGSDGLYSAFKKHLLSQRWL